MNTLKTMVLMAVLTGLLVVTGKAVGGANGMFMAFGIALLMNGVTCWFSDKIVLTMHRARELTPGDTPKLHGMVERLCQRSNCPSRSWSLSPLYRRC